MPETGDRFTDAIAEQLRAGYSRKPVRPCRPALDLLKGFLAGFVVLTFVIGLTLLVLR